MSRPRPRSVSDLALAPVLLAIEGNLTRLRDSGDPGHALTAELGDGAVTYHWPAERAARIRNAVTRDVDLHGWRVEPTADLQGLAVERGSHRVSVMLGKRLADYVQWGTASQAAAFESPRAERRNRAPSASG